MSLQKKGEKSNRSIKTHGARKNIKAPLKIENMSRKTAAGARQKRGVHPRRTVFLRVA